MVPILSPHPGGSEDAPGGEQVPSAGLGEPPRLRACAPTLRTRLMSLLGSAALGGNPKSGCWLPETPGQGAPGPPQPHFEKTGTPSSQQRWNEQHPNQWPWPRPPCEQERHAVGEAPARLHSQKSGSSTTCPDTGHGAAPCVSHTPTRAANSQQARLTPTWLGPEHSPITALGGVPSTAVQPSTPGAPTALSAAPAVALGGVSPLLGSKSVARLQRGARRTRAHPWTRHSWQAGTSRLRSARRKLGHSGHVHSCHVGRRRHHSARPRHGQDGNRQSPLSLSVCSKPNSEETFLKMVLQIMAPVGEAPPGLADCLGRSAANVAGSSNSRNPLATGRVSSRTESWAVGRVPAAAPSGNPEALVCPQGGPGSTHVWFSNATSWPLKTHVRCSIRFLNRTPDMVPAVSGP